jgi:hypothetical protein
MRLRTTYDNATQHFVATLAAAEGNDPELRFDSAEAFRLASGVRGEPRT